MYLNISKSEVSVLFQKCQTYFKGILRNIQSSLLKGCWIHPLIFLCQKYKLEEYGHLLSVKSSSYFGEAEMWHINDAQTSLTFWLTVLNNSTYFPSTTFIVRNEFSVKNGNSSNFENIPKQLISQKNIQM